MSQCTSIQRTSNSSAKSCAIVALCTLLLAACGPAPPSRHAEAINFAALKGLGDFEFALTGGLMSYGPSLPDSYRRAAIYVGRILKGDKPADLPVMQPEKYELVINLNTAKMLGLTVPDKLLATADEVIE